MPERDEAIKSAIGLALKKELVTQPQVDETLDACKEKIESKSGADARTIVLTEMVSKSYLTPAQKNMVEQSLDQHQEMRLGDFVVVSKIGQGGMGAVYEARQVGMERMVALKLLPPELARDEMYVKRFYQEARAVAKLDHPNIVRGIAVGESNGQHYFAMEFVEGDSLRAKLKREKQLSLQDTLAILVQMCRALKAAHGNNIIHRDIKPDNILLTKDGKAKLSDLGLAKETDALERGMTMTGASMGTPSYMAPEQAADSKRADARSDIYSLGATVYHCLAGTTPYKGDTAYEVVRKAKTGHLKGLRTIRSEVPEYLDLIVSKMMSVDPQNRFASAQDVLDALAKHIKKRKAVAPKKPSGEIKVPARNRWVLQFKDREGRLQEREYSTKQIRSFIMAGKISPRIHARKALQKVFMLLSDFKEFVDIPVVQEEQIRRSHEIAGAMKTAVSQYDKGKKYEKIRRKLFAILAPIIMVAVLVIAGLLVYHFREAIWSLFGQGGNPTPSP